MGGTLTNTSATAVSYSGDMNAGGATIFDGVGDITYRHDRRRWRRRGVITKNAATSSPSRRPARTQAPLHCRRTLASAGPAHSTSSPVIIVGTAPASTAKLDGTGVTGGVYSLASGQTLKGGGPCKHHLSRLGQARSLRATARHTNTGNTSYAGGGNVCLGSQQCFGHTGSRPRLRLAEHRRRSEHHRHQWQ